MLGAPSPFLQMRYQLVRLPYPVQHGYILSQLAISGELGELGERCADMFGALCKVAFPSSVLAELFK